ncbi:uncharacterized protein LOC120176396 [Hibiscus syriacus]|uniref:uncharacterized protein LOC120176396 n=1 Tax=Hibiscus syriacus TaxID=106335 RepID=UPI0019237591|nr:uncharacterized protein LOC120176396 [Hibiscus syriacus]
MDAPSTPTTVLLSNVCGYTVTLVASTYEGAPNVIKSGDPTSKFPQDTSIDTFGSVMYAIENSATWIVVWTANNQVATKIIRAGTPVIWKDIWDSIRWDHAEDSSSTASGWVYNSVVDISSNGDAQILRATLSSAPVPTTVKLENVCGDTLKLVSSTYEGAPDVIKSGAPPVVFEQDTSINAYGSVVYAVGKIATWVVVWTANNQVTTSILPAGDPVIWEEIWKNIQPDHADDSYPTSYGWGYNSEVDINSSGDAQSLSATITSFPLQN